MRYIPLELLTVCVLNPEPAWLRVIMAPGSMDPSGPAITPDTELEFASAPAIAAPCAMQSIIRIQKEQFFIKKPPGIYDWISQ
jgi:hypothetical protein